MGPFGAGEVCVKAVLARLMAANQEMNVFLPDSKWMRHSRQIQMRLVRILPAGQFLTRDNSAIEGV